MSSTTILWIRYYYYSRFTEEETETQMPKPPCVVLSPFLLLGSHQSCCRTHEALWRMRAVGWKPEKFMFDPLLCHLLWSRPSHLVFPSLVALLYKSICLFYPKWFLKASTKIIVNPLKTVKLYTYIVNSWGMCRAASNRIADQQWFQQIQVDFVHTAGSLEVGFWHYRHLSF